MYVLLHKEVSKAGSYFSILKVIADGNHKLRNISIVLNVKQLEFTKGLENRVKESNKKTPRS